MRRQPESDQDEEPAGKLPRTPRLSDVDAVEGWLSKAEAELLFQLASQVERGCIVEVGSYQGRSTVALAAGAAGGSTPVYAIEPHEKFEGVFGGRFGPEDRGAFYRNMLRTGAYRHVRLVNRSSEVVTPGWTTPVGLLWVDGDHRYEQVRLDLAAWLPHLTADAVVAFDDATNPRAGPFRVVAEAVESGRFREDAAVGKVRVLSRRHP